MNDKLIFFQVDAASHGLHPQHICVERLVKLDGTPVFVYEETRSRVFSRSRGREFLWLEHQFASDGERRCTPLILKTLRREIRQTAKCNARTMPEQSAL